MTNFGSINHSGVDARRAHLALIEGGAQASSAGTTRAATEALGTAPVLQVAAATTRSAAATAYARTTAEGPRSSHEKGIRAVARQFDHFEQALLPMVLASGVSGEAAGSVVAAIQNNPALKAQAERAFQQARAATA